MPACSAVATMSARMVSLWAMILSTTSVHAVASDMPAMSGGMSTIKMDNSAPVSAASAMAYLTEASLHDWSPVTTIMRLYIPYSSHVRPTPVFTTALLQGPCQELLCDACAASMVCKTRGRMH